MGYMSLVCALRSLRWVQYCLSGAKAPKVEETSPMGAKVPKLDEKSPKASEKSPKMREMSLE